MKPCRMGTRRGLTPGYRWTCPVCGASRVATALESEEAHDATRARAERALLAHVQSSIGGGHGPKSDLPDGLTAEALAEFVEPVEE